MTPAPLPRWYRGLLRLFPADFRRQRLRDIERLAADMAAEGRSASPGARFWIALARDAVAGALAERTHALAASLRPFTTNPGATMSTFATALRQAARQLLRQPAYSGIIVLLVAIGIAGNATVFRLFDGLFLRPLPFDEPQQLVDLDVTAPDWNLDFVNVAIADFNDWREESTLFQGMTAYTTGGGNFVGPDQAVRVTTLSATHDVDDVLRLTPALGRFFTSDEDRPQAPLVAMISQGFWQQQFGADPGVIGQQIRFGGETYEVIGVLPPQARLLGDADLWLPLREDDESSYYLTVIGRLREAVTVEQARQELQAIHVRQVADRPQNEITSPTVMLLRDRYLGEQRLGGVVLLGAVGMVLLIACGNIAGLMLARSTTRADELGLRAALGASRLRLVQQLLTEALLLSGIGGLIGLALSLWGSSALVDLLTAQFPPFVVFDLDVRFVLFVMAATIGTAVVAGLGPALRASSSSAALSATTRTTASRGVRRLMGGLVAGEVALATLLLVVSGLAVADIRAVGHTDPGFRVDGVLTYRVAPDPRAYPTTEDRQAFWTRYRERLAAIPGVDDVVVASILPLMGHSGWFFQVEGATTDSLANVVVLRRWVEPGYFRAMQVPVMSGRGFDDFDGRGEDARVAIVNESFVRSHLSGVSDPIGQRIKSGDIVLTVVGVVPDTKHYGLDGDTRPSIYEPSRQNPSRLAQVALVSDAAPATLVEAARMATRDVDATLPIFDVRSMQERLDLGLTARRSSSWFIATFSTVALILAAAGLYGLVSFSVGQRAREIGIRLALGAQRGGIERQVIAQGLGLAAGGLALGLVGAWLASGVASRILVAHTGGSGVFAGVAALVLAVTFVANWAPAHRAGRIDPLQLLRRD